MKSILNVHLLPELADPHEIAGHTSVVIDVLRASTTIITALVNGAEAIVPCLTVEEARKLAHQRGNCLLGGERGGEKLPGFDFGNSPKEYGLEQVEGRVIVFTTTNGTKAMTRCMGSEHILIGSLVNRKAVAAAIASRPRTDIICAGTNGVFSMDDALAAGAIVNLLAQVSQDIELNDGAQICERLWVHTANGAADISTAVEANLALSHGGRNLIQLGMNSDLGLAADVDRYDCVPELDKSNWEIR